MVVEHHRVHIRGVQAGAGPQVAGGVLRFGDGEVGAVDDAVVAGAGALGRRLNQGQRIRVAQFAGALRRGHHDGGRAVVFLAEVEDVQGSTTMREFWWSSMVMGSRRRARGLRDACSRSVTATQPKWRLVAPYWCM